MLRVAIPLLSISDPFDVGVSAEGVLRWGSAVGWMETMLPLIHMVAAVVIVFWIAALLPLSFFRRAHSLVATSLKASSVVMLGVCCWQSFIVTYKLFGWLADAIGLLAAGLGVIPLAIAGTAERGDWNTCTEIATLTLLALAARAAARHLDRRKERNRLIAFYVTRDYGTQTRYTM